MGNVMKFLSLYLNGFIFLSCHGYHLLLVLGKDILLIIVFKHIFLSIVLINILIIFFLSILLFNLSGKLTYLSRDNFFLR